MHCPSPRFVVTDRTGTVGAIAKETAEIGRAVFDYSCWLDTGEGIVTTGPVRIVPTGEGCGCASAWRTDYPFPSPADTDPPVDTDPLVLNGVKVRDSKMIELLVGHGTPGLSYTVSFLAYGSSSGRKKQVNFCVAIPKTPVVSPMPDPDPCRLDLLTVTASTALPTDLSCTLVEVDNTTDAEITITLPPTPDPGQTLTIVDVAGNAWQHTIHVKGDASDTILGAALYDLRVAYQSAEFAWNGSKWVVF